MLTTLAQIGIPSQPAQGLARELPKPEGQTHTVLWAVVGAALLLIIFGFVIKMKMDGDR